MPGFDILDLARLPGLARFGIDIQGRLGIPIPVLRKLAKTIGRDHDLASALWETAVPEAMLLATMVDDPARVTSQQMDTWVADIQSWDICDSVCGNLFDKTPYAWEKVPLWAADTREFVRRAGYVMIACLAWHDKNASDDDFTALFPLIKAGACDTRNFVRKAVSWAVRNIGKRSLALNTAAVSLSRDILAIDDKTARWIAKGALRELTSAKTLERLRVKELKKP